MQYHDAKLVISGDGGVGKTSIVTRKVQGVFIREYDPTTDEAYRQLVIVNGEQIMFYYFDTTCSERYSSILNSYYRCGDGFLIVYSITNRYSFDQVRMIYDKIHSEKDEDNIHVPIIIAANKIDLEDQREVTLNEGKQLADELNLNFYECSAKEDININELFETVELNIINHLTQKIDSTSERTHGCLLC